MAGIDSLVRDVSINGALLDQDGVILEVSEGWRKFADGGGLCLDRYGVGANYLKYCVFPDARSAEILRGLTQVLNQEVDCYATLYPCDSPNQKRWYLLVAFPTGETPATGAVLHIDVSHFLKNKTAPSAAMSGVGPAAMDQMHAAVVQTVRRSLAAALSNAKSLQPGQEPEFGISERQKFNKLNERQLRILRHLATGASNAEIAKIDGISVNTAKAQVVAVIRTLGFANRTQAALFAARNGIGPK